MGYFFILAQIQNPSATGMELSFGGLLLKTLLAMAFILALAFIFIRYVLPRLYRQGGPRGAEIQILEKQNLDVRKALYLVKVKNKKYLLSSSEQSVQKIAEFDDKN